VFTPDLTSDETKITRVIVGIKPAKEGISCGTTELGITLGRVNTCVTPLKRDSQKTVEFTNE